MLTVTNLVGEARPFRLGLRPAGNRTILAAVGLSWAGYVPRPLSGCVVYLPVGETTDLLDGPGLDVCFEVLLPEAGDEPAVFAAGVDDRLMACRSQAAILAAHDLDRHLDRTGRLAPTRRLSGVDGVRALWADRADHRHGTPKMIDTAHDLGLPNSPAGDRLALLDASDLTTLVTAGVQAKLTGLTATDSATGLTTVPAPADERVAQVRRALVSTLAVALIAARSSGRYTWAHPINVNDLVTDIAGDILTRLGDVPLPDIP